MMLPQNRVQLPEAHQTCQPWSWAVHRGFVTTASACKINNNNRAILLLPHPAPVHVSCEEPGRPLGAAEIAAGPLGMEGAMENGREIWALDLPVAYETRNNLNKWLHEIPFAFWLSALPPMVSGLSLRLGFTQTFVCTSSVATLTTAANNPCFIFTFEGHSKHFIRVPSDSWLGLAGSCFLNSFLPRTEQYKMTTQQEQGPRQWQNTGVFPVFSSAQH